MRDRAFAQKTLYICPTKLPNHLIESILDYTGNLPYKEATVDFFKTKKDIRSTKVSFIPWDEWIPSLMMNCVLSANQNYFNYDLSHWDTPIQVSCYEGKDKDFYTWHVDSGNNAMKPRVHGELYERKLSCSLVLSDPDEYEGGELQFHYGKMFFESLKPEKGTAIVFPSWLPHRVRPVKKGRRVSLVGWMNGPAFR